MSTILFFKSQVAGYTRRDGTYVKPHSDRRTKRADAAPGQRSLFDDAAPPAARDPVESPAFKQWFGASKVIDDEGKPQVVHHFTYADFDEFDRLHAAKTRGRNPEGIDTLGSWFTDNKDAPYVAPGRGKRMDVYLSIKKPLYIDDIKEGDGFDQLQKMVTEANGASALRAKLKEQGYDGIILNGTMLDTVRQNAMIAFEPNQIKSATANSGAFDAGSGVITKAIVFLGPMNAPPAAG